MKKLKKGSNFTIEFWAIALFILSFLPQISFGDTLPHFLTKKEDTSLFIKSDKLLIKMGFEDFSTNALNTLEEESNLSDVVKLALEKNSNEYLPLIHAREISNLTYVLLNKFNIKDPKNELTRKIKILSTFAIQQLANIPSIGFDRDNVEHASSDIDQRYDFQKNLIFKNAQARFDIEKNNILKYYVHLLREAQLIVDDESVDWLDERLTKNISKNFTNQTKQQAHYLGRSLLFTLMKFMRENKLNHDEEMIKALFASKGLFLSNFITTTYTISDNKNALKSFPLKSGDFAYEYSHGDEAFFTSLVVRPSSDANKTLAEKYNLLSKYKDAPKFLKKEKYYSAIDKMNTGLTPTSDELKTFQNYWDENYGKGFSHSGIVEIKTDNESDLSIVWIWDIFPDTDSIGTVRLVNPESFALSEKHLRIGFSRLSPKKLLNEYNDQRKKRGYLSEIWNGFSSFVGKYVKREGSGPAIDSSERYSWPAKIDEKTFLSWENIPSEKADLWFNEIVLPRVFKQIRNYVDSSEAKVFADGLLSAKDMLYCSQMMVVAFLEVTNIDIQPDHDVIPKFLIHINQKLKFFDTRGIENRVISPNGLIWQSKVHESFDYANLNVKEFHDLIMDPKKLKQKITEHTQMLSSFEEVNKIQLDDFQLYILNKDFFKVVDYLN